MLVAPCPVLASLYLKKRLGFSWPWCAVTPSAPLGTNTQPSSRSAFVFEPSLLGRFSPFISVLLWWLAVLWSPLQHVEALSPKCRQSGGGFALCHLSWATDSCEHLGCRIEGREAKHLSKQTGRSGKIPHRLICLCLCLCMRTHSRPPNVTINTDTC